MPMVSYKNCHIYPQCLPIPTWKQYQYAWHHDDYDGAPDGFDNRSGDGPTVDDCKRQIDELDD